MLAPVERVPGNIEMAAVEKSKAIAVMEERVRLSREMHDSLAQALSYLSLQAMSAREMLDRGEIDNARTSLSEVVRTADETYINLRETLFCLRAVVPWGNKFFPALREYLDEYRIHYGLDVQLVVKEGFPSSLQDDTAVQLYRIVLEALSNVRKHTVARRAWLRFEGDGGQGRVSVEDDGQGFDMIQTMTLRQNHFGLQIMRERAESIGGSFEVHSKPGCGTRVDIRVPLE